MGQMTTSTLLRILAGGGGSAGFGEAQSHVADALEAFEAPVWEAIKSQTYWTGAGQAEAESVLHTNVLAFTITNAWMESGAAAMSAATLGFSGLAANLDGLIKYAESLRYRVSEDGVLSWDSDDFDEDVNPELDAKRFNTELAIQQTLKNATILDRGTKAALQTISANRPVVVDNAADAASALPKNKELLEEAFDSRREIFGIAAGWLAIGDSLIGAEEVRAADWRYLDDLKKHVDDLDKLLELIESGLGNTSLGPALSVWRRDFLGLIGTGIGITEEARAKYLDELGDYRRAAWVRAPWRLLKIAGWASTALEVGWYLLGRLGWELPETSHPVVDPGGDTRAIVGDFELADLGSGFYDTRGAGGDHASLADVAHQQRLGALDPGQFDYVGEAEQLRSRLQGWLDAHPDASVNDKAYAEGLIAELDRALG